MNIEELREWAEKHSIERKTVETFEGFLINYENDNPKEFDEVFGTINKKI